MAAASGVMERRGSADKEGVVRFRVAPYFSIITVIVISFLCQFHLAVGHKEKLISLTEDSWTDVLQGEWMVEFYAPWCPACKALEPVWKEFSGWSDDLGLKVGSIDVTAQPGLSGRFLVTALPTIYHVKDGVFRQYRGARDKDAFISFIEEQKWKSIEPISKWKNPASFQMSIISSFFRLSMGLRWLHNRLVEEYGIPYWLSYVIFALATILIGSLLGLLLVCIVDIVVPAKVGDDQQMLLHKKTDEGGDAPVRNESDEPVDDIVDDDDTVTTTTEVKEDVPRKKEDEEEEEGEEEEKEGEEGKKEEEEEEGETELRHRRPIVESVAATETGDN